MLQISDTQEHQRMMFFVSCFRYVINSFAISREHLALSLKRSQEAYSLYGADSRTDSLSGQLRATSFDTFGQEYASPHLAHRSPTPSGDLDKAEKHLEQILKFTFIEALKTRKETEHVELSF
jgi:hypothetical protein